ncbi:homocysteine S-methyltransferase [Candidatus Symbiopectobacterium sp. NZEC127]|uniref:homocysteine S-methyltransferase n=1 Tax=Candidatus Symbiopectobacterium sp. NZEC127 TaxID=2820472 RepID=UPI002225F085|nr:homocysteine S-methyltransferase [Candidatus Symbiopectobacterium sp. NZEC127]MCW2484497.1 homocysteine S-methyltransferase [Candidatus Symbiopectobacterium sp. NZEC127]
MLPENPLAALLARSPVVILDGALATELEARGCDLCDPLWSAKVLLEAPALIYQVHYDYFAAGAQCAITASYQATPQGFAARGLSEAEALALIARSVELAVRAREDYRAAHPDAGALLVAGSVGPYGAVLANGAEYRGDYQLPQAEMMAFHRPRIAALVDAGVDVLACETQPSLPEMAALLQLLREFPSITAWFAFTLRDEQHISDGTPLCDVVALLDNHPQVVAMGINCVAVESATAALAHLSSLTSLPLVVYPNSGEHYDATTKRWRATGEQACALTAHLSAWRAAGARLIGGCCRTTPQDIAAISHACRHEEHHH